MADLAFPLLSLGVASPLAAAALVWARKDSAGARAIAVGGAGLSVACALEALREVAAGGFAALAEPFGGWFFVDGLSAAPLALFSAVAFGVLLVLPRRDSTPEIVSSILLMLGGTSAAYTASNLVLLFAAWCVAASAILIGGPDRNADRPAGRSSRLPAVMLAASAIALAIGFGLMVFSRLDASPAPFAVLGGAGASGGRWAFCFLMLAVHLRKGIFPFHSWILTALKRGPLLPGALLINTHLGAYLVARIAIPSFPEVSGFALSIVSDLALLTAVYAAVVALAERDPRRLIGLLAISQASFILAGLETATPEGAAGGLIYWMVVTVATTSLAAVYRLIEVRVGRPISGEEYLGLAAPFPRLAVFFIVSGLALVGLPGTLGFCADELLLHGAMESHPQLGLALPIAAALNAFSIFRLFSRLFLGSRGIALPGVPDARPAERWVLTGGLLFLIGGGLFPAHVLSLRADAAHAIAATANAANDWLSSLSGL